MASKGQKFKSYPLEFKEQILKEYFDGNGAESLGHKYSIAPSTIRNWINKLKKGGNGKSTFCNTILKVFGDYGGTLNSDNLFVNNGKSSRFEKAFLKGKRLIISSENEQGARLNDGMIKQLCSTDRIKGEKKFKDEFDFIPSHTMILYTNHLPKVTTGDDGTWRRLKVIPFTNKFTGNNDIKNYSEYLFDNCKEYILF